MQITLVKTMGELDNVRRSRRESMTLKAVVDSLDDIPEAFKSEYKEKDGKFFLDLDDTIKAHTAILPLSNTLTSQKTKIATLTTENTTLKAKTAGLPEDFTPVKFEELQTELDALKAEGGADGTKVQAELQKAKGQYESRIAGLETKHAGELQAKDTEIGNLNNSITKLVADDGLTKALVQVGVGKEFLKASNAMLKSSVKVIKDETTGDYRPVVESDLGDLPLDQFVENWSKSEEGKVFVKPASGGGGAGSGGGGAGTGEVNPWAANTKNLTHQGQIIRTDKVKAERMMKAAGVAPDVIKTTLSQPA